MKLAFALTALFVVAAPLLAQAQQQTPCAYGQQPCQNARPVPFPVVNLGSGLNTILTYPLRNNQPPPPAPPPSAHIATPPPVLPPGY
jgi:hypothetical protein